MNEFKRLSASALAITAISTSGIALAQTEKPGSAYVQCDGMPNNVTAGETTARLLGAVTLLGLFAPPPEAPDASKRKFGADGVAACTSLLEGEKAEGNPSRRTGLMLGRAIHQIEAKSYDAALADVARARADAASQLSDPYFARSRGRSFDLIEGAALLRMGKPAEAREASLRGASALEYSLFGLLSIPTYGDILPDLSEAEDRHLHWQTRLIPVAASMRADRLDLAGRFADSARVRDAYVDFDAEHTPEADSSVGIARAALAHALAGNTEIAATRAAAARANAEKRRADGKPESDASEYVELLDLYGIVEAARGGDAKTARRLFAARSQWVGASLGSVMEVNRRLRAGAAPDELIGSLARDSEALWDEHEAARRAALLARDSDNKSLFALTPGLTPAGGYESLSKQVWRTDKSRLILKTKIDPAKNRMEALFLPLVDPTIAMEAYVLHAALLARSRGHQGFVILPVFGDNLVATSFRTGDRGKPGFADDLFIAADDAIAKLSPIIPSPDTLKARRAAKS